MYRAFGYPFDRRVSRFEEALTIIHGLLRTGRVDFVGKFHEARECELRPRGPRPQGPPILIGSSSPRMLRLAARYADAWNTWGTPLENIPARRAAVDAACAEAGRQPATMGRTATVMVQWPGGVPYPRGFPAWNADLAAALSGPPEVIAAGFRAYAREGIDHLQVWVNPPNVAGVEALAPVLELLDRG